MRKIPGVFVKIYVKVYGSWLIGRISRNISLTRLNQRCNKFQFQATPLIYHMKRGMNSIWHNFIIIHTKHILSYSAFHQ
jgi:hypothetical protein